jgi:hypothetical protein
VSTAAAVVRSPLMHRKRSLFQGSCQRKPALPSCKVVPASPPPPASSQTSSITHACCRWRVVAFACLPVCAGTCAAAAMGMCFRLPACVVLISLLDLFVLCRPCVLDTQERTPPPPHLPRLPIFDVQGCVRSTAVAMLSAATAVLCWACSAHASAAPGRLPEIGTQGLCGASKLRLQREHPPMVTSLVTVLPCCSQGLPLGA